MCSDMYVAREEIEAQERDRQTDRQTYRQRHTETEFILCSFYYFLLFFNSCSRREICLNISSEKTQVKTDIDFGQVPANVDVFALTYAG